MSVKQVETEYRRETLCSCKAAKGTHRRRTSDGQKSPADFSTGRLFKFDVLRRQCSQNPFFLTLELCKSFVLRKSLLSQKIRQARPSAGAVIHLTADDLLLCQIIHIPPHGHDRQTDMRCDLITGMPCLRRGPQICLNARKRLTLQTFWRRDRLCRHRSLKRSYANGLTR